MVYTSANYNQGVNLGRIDQEKLPTLDTADQLIAVIKKFHQPKYKQICLNFAYPLSPEIYKGNLDGRLLSGTKEHKFSGLVGYLVGEWLAESLAEPDLQVVVANDVVCLALAGLHNHSAQVNESLLSMVYGTGNNIGMFLDQDTVVNLETGNFNHFDSTPSGLEIDQNSAEPGRQKFEKEVAGAYLEKHFDFYSRKQGLGIALNNPGEFFEILRDKQNPGYSLAKQITWRCSALLAALLRGLWLYKDRQNLLCNVEGSMYWKTPEMALSLDQWLIKLTVPEGKIRFNQVENSHLIGAGLLANSGVDLDHLG